MRGDDNVIDGVNFPAFLAKLCHHFCQNKKKDFEILNFFYFLCEQHGKSKRRLGGVSQDVTDLNNFLAIWNWPEIFTGENTQYM